jgi:tetratricopeptide (TPR) repeat protein
MQPYDMKKYRQLFILFLTVILASCSSQSKTIKPEILSDIQKQKYDQAYEHYFNGALLDFQDQYERALIEYYQALLYDSTSAQILKAIARNLLRLQSYDSAIQYLEKSEKYNPEDRETLNYLAEAYYNQQNFQKSIFYYNRLLTLDPYNNSTQNNLIFLYTHLKMEQELMNFYKKLMAYYPDDNKYAIQYALANIRLKNTSEAQKILQEVVNKDSSDLNTLFVLGNLYEIEKDTVNALKIYKNILLLDPMNDEVLNRLYRLYRSTAQWEEMVNFYEVLLQKQENPQLRLMLAETYYLQEKRTEAKTALQPILNDDTYRLAAYELLGRMAFEEENYPEAEKYFSTLTEENPDNRFAWLFLAVLYNRQNNYQNSLKVLERALTLHTDDVDLLAIYGTTLSQVGRDQEAVLPLEKALKMDSTNMSTVSSIAAVYDKLKMWDKSDSLYEMALQKAPENALLLNNYSYSLAQRNLDLTKALDLVTRALEIDPENGAYLDTKGWIYYKVGDFPRALEYIQKALDSREESAEVLEHLGDVYLKLDQPDQAKIYWQKALEKDPDNTDLAEKIQNL